jgi:DNA-binding NarL/FixJ family response regulator
MSESTRRHILILDPDRDHGELFVRALETRRDCKCYLALKEEEAIDLLKDIRFDLLLIDMGALGLGDFNLLKRIKRLSPDVIVVVDAYLHQQELISRALALGAHGYIIKPIKVDSLRKKINDFCVAASTV